MRSASGGPRVLLRRLRETMAEQVSAQERLDKIVVLIAANMVMNQTPREEIDRYLAEHFKLTDRRGLLDEVYAAFGD